MFLAFIILCIPYTAILLRSAIRLPGAKPFIRKPSRTFISVIIACKNEAQNIPVLLSSLKIQDHPAGSFEIIIVDDNSDDGTAALALSNGNGLQMKVISNKGSGKKEAIRTGVTESSGDLILATDADCIPAKSWISTIASFFDSCAPDMIIGPVRLQEKKGLSGRFQELEFLSLQGITASTALSGNAVICNGANLAFTKKAYFENACNLRFDIATGDDVFLLHSMKAKGSDIKWLESADAIVVTEPARDLQSFFAQRKRWASKASAYKDRFSIILGTVTFITVLLQAFLTVAAFTGGVFPKAFLAVFIVKSIPDLFILYNTAWRYGRKELLWWFIPSQLIYPFYVIATVVIAALHRPGSNFPSQTGT